MRLIAHTVTSLNFNQKHISIVMATVFKLSSMATILYSIRFNICAEEIHVLGVFVPLYLNP